MLYYLKKTWLDSSLTILCQIITSGVAVFAALASMKALDGLLEQDATLFFWGLTAHLGAWQLASLLPIWRQFFITGHFKKSTV